MPSPTGCIRAPLVIFGTTFPLLSPISGVPAPANQTMSGLADGAGKAWMSPAYSTYNRPAAKRARDILDDDVLHWLVDRCLHGWSGSLHDKNDGLLRRAAR